MALASEPVAFDFDDLFREHAPGLLRLIRSRVGDVASADDVLQETFVRFFRFYVLPGRLDPSRPVGPLLAVIATREAARRGRMLGRQLRLDTAVRPVMVSEAVGSDDHVAALHREPIVRAVLASLSPRQRRLLIEWEARRSTESLAVAEQVSVPVLKQVVTRARHNFRERYREAGGLAVVGGPLSWLRSRLRVDPTRHDLVATGLGLAACTAAFVTVVGSGPTPSRAAEVAANRPIGVPLSPLAVIRPPAPDVRAHTPRSVSTLPPGTVAPVETVPGTEFRMGGHSTDVGISSDTPAGQTRSFREFTVQCEAGMTARLVCTALDQTPRDLSGQGDP